MKKAKNSGFKMDAYVFLSSIVVLLGIGIVMVLSSSFPAAALYRENPFYYAYREITNLGLALIAAVAAYFFAKYFEVKRFSFLFWLISYVLVIFTLVSNYAVKTSGSSRWLDIMGFSFQPSELLKVTVILFIATVILNIEKKKNFQKIYIKDIAFPMFIIGLSSVTVLLQPDFTSALIIFLSGALVIYFSKTSIKTMTGLFLGSIPIITVFLILERYRVKRLLAFLNPWEEPLGSGYQVIHSLYSLALGGITGVGMGLSKQKYLYLPEAHTDFIFSILGEEFGFIGTTLVVFLFMVFFYSGIRLSLKMDNLYAKRVSLALVSIVTFQAIVNMGATTLLFPATGITLPFISFGGTSLLVTLTMMGLIIGFSVKGEKNEAFSFRRRNSRSRISGDSGHRVNKRRTAGS